MGSSCLLASFLPVYYLTFSHPHIYLHHSIGPGAEDIPDRTISHSRPSHKLTPVQSTRCSPFPGALAIGDLVKSTLGPKISQSTSAGDFNATNDGATILRSIQLHDAAVKILVNIWKVQDNEVGDGTTSVCVLVVELLKEAERLIVIKSTHRRWRKGIRLRTQQPWKHWKRRPSITRMFIRR